MTEKILKAKNEAEYLLNQLQEKYPRYDITGEFRGYGNHLGYEIDIINLKGDGVLLYTTMFNLINELGYQYCISVRSLNRVVIMFNDYKKDQKCGTTWKGNKPTKCIC